MFPFQGLPGAAKTGVGVSGGGGPELWWNPGYCVWGSLRFHTACEVVTSLMSYGAMAGACLYVIRVSVSQQRGHGQDAPGVQEVAELGLNASPLVPALLLQCGEGGRRGCTGCSVSF